MLADPRLVPRLAGFLMGACAMAAAAQGESGQDGGSAEDRLEPIEVFALPLGSEADYTPASFDLLEDDLLFQRSEATLGDTLDGLPGVHVDSYGGGAGRPVIRGQTAPRVTVLSDGASLFDASAVSPDHAITVEPMLARRVEVLRGPATLLYGGGAIGGVVNVLDDRIPVRLPTRPLSGFLGVRGNTVADERAAALGLTIRAADHLAVRVEGARRDAGDYEVNGFTVPRIDGTYARGDTGSVGASWVGERGYLGLAYSDRNDDYGLPGHSHEFESCTADGSTLDCAGGHDHEHDHGHEAPAVDLGSRRLDLRGEYRRPFAGIESVRLRSTHTDYRHHEAEAGEIGTVFRHEGYETRIEVAHAPLAGWRGSVGVQYSDAQFNTLGTEAFMPKTDTRILGIFAVERYRLAERWHLEVGARHERQWLRTVDDPRDRPSSSDSANSMSAGLTWRFAPDYGLSLSLARSQRLPHAQEMYARGVHLATNTYECGLLPDAFTCGGPENDAGIGKETAHNIGLNLSRVRGALTFDVGVFYNRVDDYIYARTLDQVEEFRLIKYTQDDTEFLGAEAELTYRWRDRLSATLFGDTVTARFRRGGGDLPRIPADRLGTRLNGFWRAFEGELEVYRAFAQDDIAEFESRTPDHVMVNATLAYSLFSGQRYTLFLRGSNLLGEEVWNHASFLADIVPEPGRNLTAGVRMEF